MNITSIWEKTQQRYSTSSLLGTSIRYTFQKTPKTLVKKYKTTVLVQNIDTVTAAISLPGSLMLNMANDKDPGGYPERVGAQEEDLFRRSNIYRYLLPHWYPIRDNQVLVSDKVEVFSDGLRERYTPYSNLQYINVISCPGVKNNQIGIELNPIDAQRLLLKLNTLFQAAYDGEYKDLVLSALGCGGFRCPPEHVSKIFKEVIEMYDGCFETIVFAIFDCNYPKCNYRIFKQTLDSDRR